MTYPTYEFGGPVLKVFMSYAAEDRSRVHPYFAKLKALGVDPWMDAEKLLPGQQWEGAIEKAFREAEVVVLFLSKKSVSKRGFVRREANEAIQNLRYKKPDDIYVIPLLLEECEVPFEIAGKLQYVDLSNDKSWPAVRQALATAAKQLEIAITEGEQVGVFRFFTETIKERRNGAPGYDIDVAYPRLFCPDAEDAAAQLSAIFAGRAATVASKNRMSSWGQMPELFGGHEATKDDGEFSWNNNGRWDSFEITHASTSFFSLSYSVSWYGARAAHPNHHFENFNFALIESRPVAVVFEDFFINPASARSLISAHCVKALQQEFWKRTNQKPDPTEVEWIESGCKADSPDAFACFTLNRDGFTFYFAPYEVSAYALGSWTVQMSFYDLLDELLADGPHKQLLSN